MAELVEQVLQSIGPCVSTRLVTALVKDHGLKPANARQKVSRSSSIKKLAHLPFPRNARFLYRQADYGSPHFWHALVRDLLEQTVAYGGGLAALLARDGIMPVAHFEIACGAPRAQKGHLSPAAILDRLKKAELVQTLDVPGIGECVELANQAAPEPHEISRMRARLRTEEVLLSAIKDWARDLGLVSYNKVALRDQAGVGNQPRVGTFNWDLTGPSYLAPMLQWSSEQLKPGFLACDVLLGVNMSEQNLRPFIHKCKTLRSLTKVGRCLQIFVADGYEQNAFVLAKNEGIIPATTETLFGQEVARALTQLTALLRDVYPRAGNLEKLEEIFARLKHIEGAALNLRGSLFEYLAAEFVRCTSVHSEIRMNEIFRDAQGRSAEVDVLVVHNNQSVCFIECKGYKPGGTVPDDEVTRWLYDRVPFVRKMALANNFWNGCKLEFEFWTTGRLTPEAQAIVAKAKIDVRKYALKIVDRDELEALGKVTNNTSLKKTLRQHFLDHPLEKAERMHEKRKRRTPIPGSASLEKRYRPDLDN